MSRCVICSSGRNRDKKKRACERECRNRLAKNLTLSKKRKGYLEEENP